MARPADPAAPARSPAERLLRPAAWAFYVVIVCEILFMISPFALHFYAAYGPVLDVLHHRPATAWLTKFYLPHFAEKVLFTRARLHGDAPSGADIVRAAYGREPLIVAHVDAREWQVTGVAVPPPHVRWGDISTPMF